MKFRLSPLAHALLVAAGWAIVLGIALGRPEPFVAAVPLVTALMIGSVRCDRVEFAVSVETDREVAVEGDDLTLNIAVQASGVTGPVQIVTALPSLLQQKSLPALIMPVAGAALSWRHLVRCDACGVFDVGRVGIRAWDLSGMWVGEQDVTRPARVTVLPRPTPVENPPRPRYVGSRLGAHASTAVGDGLSFAEIGRYAPGDRPRAINWPVSLRRQSLHANRFHPDRQADVVLLIDTLAVVGERPNSSLDHMLRAAAGLAMACLARHDRVGVLEYGGIARSVRLGTGQHQAERVLAALACATPVRTEWVLDLRQLPERILPRRALVVALTPLVDDRVVSGLCSLAERGQDVVVLALDTDALSVPMLHRRERHPLVRRLWRLERDERLRTLRRWGGRAVGWQPDRPLEAALAALNVSRFGRGPGPWGG